MKIVHKDLESIGTLPCTVQVSHRLTQVGEKKYKKEKNLLINYLLEY